MRRNPNIISHSLPSHIASFRNLFLGYYVSSEVETARWIIRITFFLPLTYSFQIPYRHIVPLWELESDYYLHNFNVKSGISQSMRDFQHEFGVFEWEMEEGKDDEIEKSNQPLRLSRHRSHASTVSLPSADRHEDQLRRIQKVRDRCDSQNKSLSIWWKVALQSNVQQRMWMKIGKSPTELTIPPRFDRVYQPEKLAQFDRFFARPWSTPVRRSHSAQHSSDVDNDAERGVFRRNISGTPHRSPRGPSIDLNSVTNFGAGENCLTLDDFAHTYGFGVAVNPGIAREESDINYLHHYVGDIDTVRALKEYEDYVSPQDENSSPFREETLEEFKEALEPLSLGSDNVAGIRSVSAMSACGIIPRL